VQLRGLYDEAIALSPMPAEESDAQRGWRLYGDG